MTEITEYEKLKDLCRSLGSAVNDSEAGKAFTAARELFRNDEEAKELLRDYNKALGEYQDSLQSGNGGEAEYGTLLNMKKAVQSNSILNNYFASQSAFLELCREVNRQMSEKLDFNFASLAKRKKGCC